MDISAVIFLVVWFTFMSMALLLARKIYTRPDRTTDGREVLKSEVCNLRVGTGRWGFGRILLASDALLWEPTGFPFPTGPGHVSIPLEAIARGTIQRDDVRLRRPLVIATNSGGVYCLLFRDWLAIGAPKGQRKWQSWIKEARAAIG